MTDSALRVLSRVLIMVARILVGEVSVVPEAALPVAIVAMNRLDAGMGYAGWHAIADKPADWALSVAWEAWRRGGDADGNLFALGKKDMQVLGFDEGNWENVGSDEWPVWVGEVWK